MGRVLVVGSVNVDLVVALARLPSAGETVSGGTFDRHAGGKGGNQAVAAARLGAASWFIGAIGEDPFGQEAIAGLERDGVQIDAVRRLTDAPTGVALILVDQAGENLIAVAPGANHEVDPDLVRASLRRLHAGDGDVVLVSCEIPTAAVGAALDEARRAGARSILNPAPADGLDRAVTGLADILTPNRAELTSLARAEARRTGRPDPGGEDAERLARRLLTLSSEGPAAREAILVTLGPAGALLVPAGRDPAIAIPAPKVVAVDSTGAGDALNGALAAGLAAGLPLEVAARRAVVAGSLATTRLGARAGMPTADELEGATSRGRPRD